MHPYIEYYSRVRRVACIRKKAHTGNTCEKTGSLFESHDGR